MGPRRIRRVLSILKRNFFVNVYHELRREFVPPRLPVNRDGKVYLHLGCGPVNVPGFTNIDLATYAHVHFIRGVENLGIFPDGYADLIYASHVLEHLSHRDTIGVLKEWHRVLKNGGMLRLSVPDFALLSELYIKEGSRLDEIVSPIMGGQEDSSNYHKAIFDYPHLSNALKMAGFTEIARWNPGDISMPVFEDWASRPIEIAGVKRLISLNIEARKS